MKLRIAAAVLGLLLVIPVLPIALDLYTDRIRADQLEKLTQDLEQLKRENFHRKRMQVNFVLRLDSYASARLLKDYPEADSIMVAVADSMGIDYLLFPAMAVTEGGTRSRLMYDKLHNLYGQEERIPGKLKQFATLKDGDISAAKLVIRLIGRDQVNLAKLASRWCPVNKGYWERTMTYCYLKAQEWTLDPVRAEQSIKSMKKSSKG